MRRLTFLASLLSGAAFSASAKVKLKKDQCPVCGVVAAPFVSGSNTNHLIWLPPYEGVSKRMRLTICLNCTNAFFQEAPEQ